jgi:hypothetical protein
MPAPARFATMRVAVGHVARAPACLPRTLTMTTPRPANLGSLYRLQGLVVAVSFAIAAGVAPDAAGPLVSRALATVQRHADALSPRLQALRVAAANLAPGSTTRQR